MNAFLFTCLLAPVLVCSGVAQEKNRATTATKIDSKYRDTLNEALDRYHQRDFDGALQRLNAAEKIQPGQPESANLRGAIFSEQHDFERAREEFERILKKAPSSFWPRYNLAEILLMQKKAAEARDAFAKLPPNPAYRELIEFKILITYLLEHEDAKAEAKLNSVRFPSDTAAYYFCHAAWELAHHEEEKGQGWIRSGLQIFGPARCAMLYDSLADMGWVEARKTPHLEQD